MKFDTKTTVRLLSLMSALGPGALAAAPATTQAENWTASHDPVVIKQGDTYYLFSTGRGIPVHTSKDLIHWTRAGRVFEQQPAWAVEKHPSAKDIWAPDISFINGEYRLYYAVSKFGTSESSIGLATNVTLDPKDPKFKWVDHGEIISTNAKSNWNAIDAAAFVDQAGQNWMAIGSYWSGIKLFKLDASGHIARDDQPRSIAARPKSTAVEAAFVTFRDGFYYLWVSFDMCCQGAKSTYNTRVGRSRNVEGPYFDRDGKSMLEGGGTVVLQNDGDVRGPGHNSVISDNGVDYLIHHWYDAAHNGRRSLGVRKLTWDEQGWPKAGPMINGDKP